MLLSSGPAQVAGEHGQAAASKFSGGERVESGAAEHCVGKIQGTFSQTSRASQSTTTLFANFCLATQDCEML